ncbi:MAG: DUF3466 family protein [Paraglaciecola sp.]|nr:DUF3466 family protein [Paraglaciecola sp.]NCT48200.1 DUF3466 family protein [Paraglaciecola sp.]
MKKTRLAAALSFSLLAVSTAQSATYRVVELPVADEGISSYPTDINSNGEVTLNVQNLFNLPIDVSLINFELQSLIDNLTDIEAAKAGDLNNDDYTLLYAFISGNAENQFFQQFASINSYLATEDDYALLHVFDNINPDTNAYMRSTSTNVRGINEFGDTVGVGQGGFFKVPYTRVDESEVTYVVNTFYTRAFANINGTTVELAPPMVIAGGQSDAFDINNNLQVVGYGTTELASEAFQTSVDNCLDETQRGDIPVESCQRSLNLSIGKGTSTYAQRRGLIWQLDDQGNVISTKALGLLLTPDDDDTRRFSGTAVAINDNGIAVGESPALYQDTEFLTTAAAIYIDDQVSTINPDDELRASTATDINNHDIVVGYGTKQVNGVTRRKFFVHDIAADTTSFPNDFFLGSSSQATAINNNDLVVGYGEVEASIGVRRTEGFVYNVATQSFSGLSSLLACDSPYTIVQANGINDNDEIVATAVVKGLKKDVRGNVVLDDDGVQVTAEVVKAVKLIPIPGGSVDSCDVIDNDNRERQGASLTWMLGMLLLGLGFRRFRQ